MIGGACRSFRSIAVFQSGNKVLNEINETDATGEIARIFEELRHLWGVPYVSAIHRHLATRPGVLEWTWDAVGPAFRSGAAQQAGWRAAAELAVPPLDRISRNALAVWGVDERGIATAREVAQGFVRVAPVNMMFAGLVKALFEGQVPGAKSPVAANWAPPAGLPVPLTRACKVSALPKTELALDVRSWVVVSAAITDSATTPDVLERLPTSPE